MKGHIIFVLKVLFIIAFVKAEFLTVDLIKNWIKTNEELQVLQKECSKRETATVAYKVNGGKEAVYIFGTCGGYRKKANIQTPTPISKTRLHPAPRKVGATSAQQFMINYSWGVSHGDEQFIAMIEAESQWQPYIWEAGQEDKKAHGYGLCQIDDRYWPEIVADPKFQSNWAYQVHVCWKLWKKGVRFYGHNRNNQMISRFWWSKNDEV